MSCVAEVRITTHMITRFHEITGTTAFLDGTQGLCDTMQEMYDALKKLGKPVLEIDNLFDQPAKIASVVSCENLSVHTTGLQRELLENAIVNFLKLKYKPSRVFFFDEQNIRIFRRQIEVFREQGTEFYLVGCCMKGDLKVLYSSAASGTDASA